MALGQNGEEKQKRSLIYLKKTLNRSIKMKTIITFITSLLLVSFAFKCKKTDLICKKWEYVNSTDAYQGGIDYTADPKNKKYLIFYKDGTFEEIDSNNHRKGKWKFNDEETKIGLAYGERNGEANKNPEQYNFRKNLTSITKTEMKFWIQGRHGRVTYTYKAVD